MKILLTGFDPFGGDKINPSFEAVKKLPDKLGEHVILKAEIPTVFNEARHVLYRMIEEVNPDIVLCIGQAGGSDSIRVERIAVNIDDARIPDNKGQQPIDKPIILNGKNAYFSNLPIKAIVHNLNKHGIKATISNSAGTFVCNHLMYSLLYLIHESYPHIKGGFIHVPYMEGQGKDKPHMSLETITQALTIAIITILHQKEDIVQPYGTLY